MNTRRSLLVGIGSLAAGSGVVMGSDAFTRVDAYRFATVETTGDAAAFLGLEALDPDRVQVVDGMIELHLGDNGGGPACDSVTTYSDLVRVTNQGTQTIRTVQFDFSVEGADQPDHLVEDALNITSGGATIDADGETNLLLESDDGDAENDRLDPGESFSFGIAVDLLNVPISCISGEPTITLTIIAKTELIEDEPPVEPVEFDLIAGQHCIAGTLRVSHTDDHLMVTFETSATSWELDQTHLAVSADEPGGGEWIDEGWQNPAGHPPPGQFPYARTHDPSVDQETFILPLNDITDGVSTGDTVYIGAHAEVSRDEADPEDSCGAKETAWSDGDEFDPNGGWAMYSTYQL